MAKESTVTPRKRVATPATTAQSAFGASKPLSFSGFASPPNQTVGSSGFGQAAGLGQSPAQNAVQNLSFGGGQQQTAPAPAFGTPTTQPPPFGSTVSTGAANSSFSFGGTAASPGFGGFATPASGFSAAQPAATTTASTLAAASSPFGAPAAFSFGAASAPASTAAAAPSFGTPPTSSFLQPAAPAPISAPTFNPQTSTPSFGTNPLFGQKTTSQLTFTPVATTTQNQVSFATTQPGSIGSVGSAGSGFGSTFATQPAKTQGISFGTTSTAVTTAPVSFGGAVSTPASTNLSFAAPTSAPSFSTSAPTPAANAPTLSFGAVTSAPTSISFGAVTSAPTSLSFGAVTSAQTSVGLGSFGTTASSFGAKTTAAPSFSTAPTTALTAPSGISALGKTTTSATLPALTTVTTTTAAPAVPAMISSISFAQLEENINKWTLDLEEQEKTFINQATQINAWDRLLIANGEKIIELNSAVQSVKNEQESLEHELDFVVAQQKELETLLAPLEEQSAAAGDRGKDPQREQMYSLAENLDTQLRQMSEDLKEVIEHLNETNRSQDSNDPIVQIGRILNAHMSSMQWVDGACAQIAAKLELLARTHDALRRDNERSFRLAYN